MKWISHAPLQAAWTLEMKRRENDKKVTALYAEMKDMMSVMIQYVKDLILVYLFSLFIG